MERLKVWSFGAVLTLGLLASNCGTDEPRSGEVSPNELAQELGLPQDDTERKVPESDLGKFDLVVDVFRKSTSRPVLGNFIPGYVDVLAPDTTQSSADRLSIAKKKFADLSSSEIAILSIHGSPYRAQIVSGALEGYVDGEFKHTPSGNYLLTPLVYLKNVPQPDGTTMKQNVLFPWIRSQKYDNSQMFWGLWIFGGYFFHSTPHYGELGQPASMGCVRQTFPDAMETFRLAQIYRSMIRIHPMGSQEAYDRFREITSVGWALPRLDDNLSKIHAYVQYARTDELLILGHGWLDPATHQPLPPDWPTCGPVDCFKIWGRKRPAD